MSVLIYFIAGLFLPLFPFSILLNVIYPRIHNPLVRSLLLLLWPQFGLAILFTAGVNAPNWIIYWAILTSLLYALRALALREVGLWTSFVATSAWTLLWVLSATGITGSQLELYAVGMSIPLVLMAVLGAGLERRFGAAYLGLSGGIARSIPRFSSILVVVVLAIIATPMFPTFFAMLSMIMRTLPVMPLIAAGIIVVWMLWSWAGARLIQGLVAGTGQSSVTDLSQAATWGFIVVLIGVIVAGMYWLGAIA